MFIQCVRRECVFLPVGVSEDGRCAGSEKGNGIKEVCGVMEGLRWEGRERKEGKSAA